MTLIKRKNIHPIFKCSDLATHITQSTRSTQSADLLGRGRSLLPYAHCKNIEAWWLKTNPPHPPPPTHPPKKVLDHYLHHNLVMLLPLWCFLLIYSSQKVPRHILVLHMHRKFDVDSTDSF